MDTVPFGKHKGHPINAVPFAYLLWAISREQVRDRYPDFYRLAAKRCSVWLKAVAASMEPTPYSTAPNRFKPIQAAEFVARGRQFKRIQDLI